MYICVYDLVVEEAKEGVNPWCRLDMHYYRHFVYRLRFTFAAPPYVAFPLFRFHTK